jgi:phage gp16-like protein
MKTTIRSAGLMILGIGLLIGGCAKMKSTSWKSIKNPEVVAQMKSFVAEKEAQVNAAAKAGGQEMPPEYKTLFAAAAKGNWPRIHDTFNLLSRRAPQYSHPGPSDDRLTGPQWAAVIETYGAFEAFADGDAKYCAAFGRDIIDSLPAGAIYFGGSDPGRFLITALCKSQVNGDPFFVLTQNALADGGYLAYLRSMYGDKVYTPTDADLQQCFGDYQRVNGKGQVSGQAAVMDINGLLARIVFDKNPDRDFFIEESFPLDWMYPYLEPHGLIFKINRLPQSALSDEIVQRDHDYWTQLVTPMIGGWLNDDTSIQGIADFARKVFLQHDFKGFTGDPQFVQNDYSCRIFSKERRSIAGLYLWRMNHAASSADQELMAREADFAFRQALALCPYGPYTASTYASFLRSQHRDSDAMLVNEIAQQFPNQK